MQVHWPFASKQEYPAATDSSVSHTWGHLAMPQPSVWSDEAGLIDTLTDVEAPSCRLAYELPSDTSTVPETEVGRRLGRGE